MCCPFAAIGDKLEPDHEAPQNTGMTQRGAGESGSPLPEIPENYWRDIPCGHPPDPVAMYGSEGHPVCHCGCILDPADSAGLPQPPEAPGAIVNCQKCGCYVAIPPKPVSTQPAPESGSEEAWCGECGLRVLPGTPPSTWTGHIHKPVEGRVMRAAVDVWAVAKVASDEFGDELLLAAVRGRLDVVGITEQAVETVNRLTAPGTGWLSTSLTRSPKRDEGSSQ